MVRKEDSISRLICLILLYSEEYDPAICPHLCPQLSKSPSIQSVRKQLTTTVMICRDSTATDARQSL